MSRLPHVYLRPPWADSVIELGPEALHHLSKVLRLGDGAPITYTDGQGNHGQGVLTSAGAQRGVEAIEARPTSLVTVAVAPPKRTERARFVVEKLAELGVEALVWVETERGEGRPPSQPKATSWAVSALQQSRGSWLMEISGPTTPSMLRSPVWAATPGGGALPDAADAVTLMIGPEGGLTPDELEAAEAQVSLGKLILRSETAALVFATLALHASGRMMPDA